MSQLQQRPSDGRGPLLLGPSHVGAGTLLAWDVIIGHPSKASLVQNRNFHESRGATVGERCILRSGTVIYEDVIVGNDVQTAHHVVIREGARIGDGCAFGNGTEVQIMARLGRNVRLQSTVMLSENVEMGNDIFIGQGVVFTGGRFMTGAAEASGRMTHEEAVVLEGKNWEGPSVVVEDEVRIGANSVILTGVRLGKGCVVGAGSVVSIDVPPGALVMGNPARILKRDYAGRGFKSHSSV
ncbi:MAG: DapH/DapD/GlmU-related protein [Bryobacteraceae bacterium]